MGIRNEEGEQSKEGTAFYSLRRGPLRSRFGLDVHRKLGFQEKSIDGKE